MDDKNNFLKNLQNSVKDKDESLKHFNELVLSSINNDNNKNDENVETSSI